MVPSKKNFLSANIYKMNIRAKSTIHKRRPDTYIKYFVEKKMSFSNRKLSQKKRKIFDSRTKGIEL